MRASAWAQVLVIVTMLPADFVWATQPNCDYKGCNWLATGVITKKEASGFSMLGKDGRVYLIKTSGAQVVSDTLSLRREVGLGDTVRVFGEVVESGKINATRVRILHTSDAGKLPAPAAGPGPEIKIVVEKTEVPSSVSPNEVDQEPRATPDWEGRGLIMEIDRVGKKLKVNSPAGQYTVNVGQAVIANGQTAIGLGSLNIGDSIRVIGSVSGFREVQAQQIIVTRPRWEVTSALPQLPVSVAGVIQNVDYASLTFTMSTQSQVIAVMVDQDTCIQSEKRRVTFSDLKPGMRVKMTGSGSLATGYAAQHIQIISLAP